MGDLVIAECRCGYSKKLMVGGGMFSKTWNFPHYCKDCGLVNAEMSDPDQPRCPECNSSNVLPYGYKEAKQTLLDKALRRRRFEHSVVSNPIGNSIVQCWSHYLTAENNLCPNCNQMSMRLSSDGNCYD